MWISADPALEEYLPTGDKKHDKYLPGLGGVFNHFNLNLYHFAGNNPIKYTDPNGKNMMELTMTWTSTGWVLCFVDGPIPIGDIIYVVGIIGCIIADLIIDYGHLLPGIWDQIMMAAEEGADKVREVINQANNMVNNGGIEPPDPGKWNEAKNRLKEIADNWPWKDTNPSINELTKGGGKCAEWARKLQKSIGGDILKIEPKYSGARYIGPLRNKAGEIISKTFQDHYAVIKDGMVYDRIVGPEGMTLENYKQLFDYSEDLIFKLVQ